MADRYRVNSNWRLVLHDLNLDEGSLMRLAGQPEDLLRRENAWVNAKGWFGLWDALGTLMGDERAPLALGEAVEAEAFDPPLFAAVCSQDLNQAAGRLSKYKELCGPMKLGVLVGSERTALSLSTSYAPELPMFLAYSEIVFLTTLARRSTRHAITPRRVRVMKTWSDEAMSDYETWLGCPLEVGDAWEIVFGAEDATRPFLTANSTMFEFFEPELKRRLSEVEVAASTSVRVKASLRELLPSGRSAIGDVARALGVSSRSLQRSLKAEGLRFRDVLSETREELARFYLGQPGVASAEIAFLLGYDDPSSFFRAFRSWTGTTPEQARASL